MSPKSQHRLLCHHCHHREPTHTHLGRILLCTPCYRYLRSLLEDPSNLINDLCYPIEFVGEGS